ncbi:hypothetical protein [Piscinibacter sp.]|uniref:hypothetical protein n=1 Tax=Piscinibacter sp. TaxID=1903157 RepID=UPI002CEA26FD|nr:hypothetical protein [Albitalea sp.]HUG24973.1 hypothetical protein [Albitalea sp.]
MSSIHDALRAGHAPPLRTAAARRVLVAGGGGALGAAVLEQLLAGRAFGAVAVLVTQPLSAALSGLVPVRHEALLRPAPGALGEGTAVVVFDRERHANGREQAFWRPDPAGLPALASALQRRGVRHLVVVMPHAPATLPQALKQGLASLDEQAVAALGFDHLVFVRSAQAHDTARSARALQRLADWVLAQLQLMIPQRDKPVRALKVAQFTAQLAAHLPLAPPGTRVVPPETVWEAAQSGDIATLARDWLHGREHAAAAIPKLRL